MRVSDWKLRTKVMVVLGAITVVGLVAIYWYTSTLYGDARREGLVQNARAVILQAESMREFVALQRSADVFRKTNRTKEEILLSVPIFSSIKATSLRAKELGFGFKVPKVSPRNPSNQPDDYENDVLNKLTSEHLSEYWAIDKNQNAIRYFRPIKLTKECLECHGDPATSLALWGNKDGLDPTGAKMENWKEGEIHGAFEVTMPLAAIDADVAAKSRETALAFVAGTLIVLLSIYLVIKNAIRPIEGLAVAAHRVAGGDLTVVPAHDRNDEIGKLSEAFGAMVANLRATVNQMVDSSSAVASASAEISSSIEQMSAGAQSQVNQTTEVAAAVEEMARSITENSQNATLTAQTAAEARKSAEDGGHIVQETIVGMREMAQVIQESSRTVEELGRSSDHIGEIISVIDDIADQTNLLALNAAIEAARAGEQGRGFAVVADEVRKLAERTTRATKEIAVMIKDIQSNTRQAVTSMGQGNTVVTKGIASADRAGAALAQMVQISQRVMDMVKQISKSSDQQSLAADQISKNVEGISTITQETAMAIQQIAAAADDLNRLMEDLKQLVSQFQLEHHVNNDQPARQISRLQVGGNGHLTMASKDSNGTSAGKAHVS